MPQDIDPKGSQSSQAGSGLSHSGAVAGRRSVVGLPACRVLVEDHPTHKVGEKYILAALDGAGAIPLLIPALGEALPLDDLLANLDGLLLTGSPSNVEPHHYDGPEPPENNPIDPARDATTLALIRRAAALDMPVLGICRGLQEMNVALGGSLHQEVQNLPGRFDHRAPEGDIAHQYRDVHSVELVEGGLFHQLLRAEQDEAGREIPVNSLHGQGIDRLGPGLVVEAHAPDGQIEGFSRPGAEFMAGVQWHPEWQFENKAFSRALFCAFGAACRRYRARRP